MQSQIKNCSKSTFSFMLIKLMIDEAVDNDANGDDIDQGGSWANNSDGQWGKVSCDGAAGDCSRQYKV